LAIAAGGAAIVLGVGLAAALTRDETAAGPGAQPVATVAEDPTRTMLLVGTTTRGDDPRALWLSLLSYNQRDERGAVIYIPANTAVEVPGRGLQGLSDALETGGMPLLLLTAQNLLGDEAIDGYLEQTESDARVLFDATGPLTVEVPAEVRVPAGRGRTQILFDDVRQELPPSLLAELLFTLGEGGDDIELGGRHLAFWDSLLATFEGRPDELAAAVTAASGAVGKSDMPPEDIAGFFGGLASVDALDRPLRALPVTPLEVPRNRLYVVDDTEVEALLAEVLGPTTPAADQVDVQILNGNGVPGIGQQVAARLVGQGFHVVLSGNAPRLDYKTTKVITYDASPEGQELARRARDLLGVGEVQVSGQEQGIVDLTIVVGKDFLRAP